MKSLAGLKLENVNIFSDEVAQARIGQFETLGLTKFKPHLLAKK